jgi:glutathione S-transferase
MRAMRVLYSFPQSVFSRRARLALAHKGLEVDLKDGRENPAFIAEAKKLYPLGTMPVLVDEGRVVGDSTAILHYLDAAYPDRPLLWPKAAAPALEALAIVNAVDHAMNTVVELGTRFYELRTHPAWAEIHREKMERAQGAIDFVATKVTRPTLAGDAWSAADIVTIAAALWVRAWPARAKATPNIAQVASLGLRFPAEIDAWAKQHEGRADVRAIYG